MSAHTLQRVKTTLTVTGQTIAFLVMLDLLILFTSLAQVMTEGRTGYWSPFWRAQAEAVISLLQ